MAEGYFQRLNRQTPTRLWVNNPTLDEAQKAVAAGAVNCTTNPTYAAGILKREPAVAREALDRVVRETSDDPAAAHRVQQALVSRIMPVFLPLHQATPTQGFVSVQGDPRADGDATQVLEECLDDARCLGPNYIAKVPVIPAGLAAIAALLRRGIPVIATEVFSLAQTAAACELYRRVARESGLAPVFFVTHITGIFDEYLAQVVKQRGIPIAPETLAEAGFAVCCAQYRLFRERRYPGAMLGGGARAARHFTDFVGSRMHITINWSTAAELLAADPPLDDRMARPTPQAAIEELSAKLPDFRKAFELKGLAESEFAEYGPVQHFRNKFIAGWDTLRDAIRQRRRKG